MARPTKLTKAIITKAKEYEQDWRLIDGSPVPTKEGMALHLDVARSTLYVWIEDDTPLGRSFQTSLSGQWLKGRTLIAHSLDGTFNSTISKMMLSKHDYVEKQQTDVTSDGKALAPVLVKFVGDRARGVNDRTGHRDTGRIQAPVRQRLA